MLADFRLGKLVSFLFIVMEFTANNNVKIAYYNDNFQKYENAKYRLLAYTNKSLELLVWLFKNLLKDN